MKVYLDNCCFNRPYDSQDQEIIRMETEAKLYIQELIRNGQLTLVWSFILDYENEANPFFEQKESIREWKGIADIHVEPADSLRISANKIAIESGLKAKDSLHIACAVSAGAEYLVTTDRKMFRYQHDSLAIINPVSFVLLLSGAEQ